MEVRPPAHPPPHLEAPSRHQGPCRRRATRSAPAASARACPQVAIAGYTNAGKSTLLHRADRRRRDRGRPAVRDPRPDDPPDRRCRAGGVATMSDTVGFVSKLPHDLVEAFRSTLEEVTLSDMIVHVADAASPALEDQIEAVHTVLEEIGAANMPEVLVLNKIDLVPGSRRARLATRYPGSVRVLGRDGRGGRRACSRRSQRPCRRPRRRHAADPLGPRRPGRDALSRRRGAERRRRTRRHRVHARVGLRELAAIRAFIDRRRTPGRLGD